MNEMNELHDSFMQQSQPAKVLFLVDPYIHLRSGYDLEEPGMLCLYCRAVFKVVLVVFEKLSRPREGSQKGNVVLKRLSRLRNSPVYGPSELPFPNLTALGSNLTTTT